VTEIHERLQELKELGLYRRVRMISGPQGPRVVLDGKPVLLLCSNNYLGLADHPRVREAAADAAMRWGVGSGASRLVSGTMTVHRRLEERLADFKRTSAALLFGSGYLANLGVIPALAREGEVVFSDELNHASIIDGCRLARAETFVYRHADVEHLAWGMHHAEGRGSLIVTDSVFSMDAGIGVSSSGDFPAVSTAAGSAGAGCARSASARDWRFRDPGCGCVACLWGRSGVLLVWPRRSLGVGDPVPASQASSLGAAVGASALGLCRGWAGGALGRFWGRAVRSWFGARCCWTRAGAGRARCALVGELYCTLNAVPLNRRLRLLRGEAVNRFGDSARSRELAETKELLARLR
jgi:hypothetical protein